MAEDSPPEVQSYNIHDLLYAVVTQNASDLHLSTGMPPLLRIDGDIREINNNVFLDNDILDNSATTALVYEIMNEAQKLEFEINHDIDFSLELPKTGRFRVNIFKQHRGIAAVFRAIPNKIMSLEELGISITVERICKYNQGLVLVTGSTGSGKSTTIAAIINELNQTRYNHIITIEDPIEYVHTPNHCLINQREIQQHTKNFDTALRAAMREDPDVIMVGELRDPESIRLALTAAETGHLVLATLHTNSATKSIDRIIDVFPVNEKEMVRSMLSESLTAVIAQVLIKRADSNGRIAAFEVMIATPAIRNLIRTNKVAQMYSTIQTSSHEGMMTLDQSLQSYISRGLISEDVAKKHLK